jgi:histidinol phosphatase-like enzyme
MIKLVIIDRDGTITHGSSDPASPFYYILRPDDLIVKPTAYAAMGILATLRRATGLKVVLATRQRCISKGLISRADVDLINEELQARLAFTFDGIYVEESADTKSNLFATILKDTSVRPQETLVIDNSWNDIEEAAKLGAMNGFVSDDYDLYTTVCAVDFIT